MVPRPSLSALETSLDGVRLVLSELQAEALRVPVNRTFFPRRSVILSSLIVTLTGYFESFLRDFAKEFAAELSIKKVPFIQLDQRIQKAHFAIGGKILSEALKPKRRLHIQAPPIDIAERLASVGHGTYNLLWESFAETQSNPGSEAVGHYLSSMAVTGGFEAVANRLMAANPQQPASAAVLKQALDALVERRNECAHTGGTTQVLSEADVENYCVLLSQVAMGIAEAVEMVIVAA